MMEVTFYRVATTNKVHGVVKAETISDVDKLRISLNHIEVTRSRQGSQYTNLFKTQDVDHLVVEEIPF